MLDAGEILTSLDARNWARPIIDLPARMGDLKRDGYAWDKVKRGRATAYYNPKTVDYGELAAWLAGGAAYGG